MKTWQKLAGTAAVVIVIAVIALYARGNWGDLANDTVNMIFEAVTGTDPGFDGFQNEDGGTKTDKVNAEW